MPTPRIALLPDRGLVSVTGPDGEKLLQGLLTSDLTRLGEGQMQLAALLTPQGKILFELLVARDEAGGLLIEVMRRHAPALVQRLQLYKLRANVEIRDVSADFTVAAAWNDANVGGGALVCRDLRHPDLGHRVICSMATDKALGNHDAKAAAAPDYHAHRIGLGVAEGGLDYEFGDAFPHEANFDLTGGVAFDKGCFIGQEVVSRMQHKSVVRKRVVRIWSTALLPENRPEVRVGQAVIGKLGSVAGSNGLAMLRLDRVCDALDRGQPIEAAGLAVSVETEAIERFRASAAPREGAT